MTLGNLRAILQRGVGTYLDYRAEDHEGEEPLKLLADIDAGRISRDRAVQFLECTIKTIIENYEEYKDYNTTTAQSDYGENLFRLIAYLRLKASYERHAWNFRPLLWVHEILVRKGQEQAALFWREAFALTGDLARRHLEEIDKLAAKARLDPADHCGFTGREIHPAARRPRSARRTGGERSPGERARVPPLSARYRALPRLPPNPRVSVWIFPTGSGDWKTKCSGCVMAAPPSPVMCGKLCSGCLTSNSR